MWWANDPTRIASAAHAALEDTANDVFISAATVWEAGVKVAAGRLEAPTPLDEVAANAGFQELPIAWQHARRAAELPPIHHDPFDRMLVGQAIVEGLVLVTRDPLVQQYPVSTMLG